ncbi:hypothetical protein DFQ28_008173 [Apophysomyces sp. BC1034]|nr:hypothetical protein DFQ30_007140 [Apophysomyces sp. BC1015]KAG0175825.1 hypothetical protein DFQ29_006968 [Apophysomyces sp. BC1021]KAG0186213.1 hypothetical protein DFQ28_008173 [Apophysomyces sp. BC1034]
MHTAFDKKSNQDDLYEILGCVDSSSQEQIKTEYKRLALQHHPDKSTNNDEMYQRIKAAYDIVGDPARRALYDRWRQSGLRIPFHDYAQLGAHAQTVHWQALPTQLTLTQSQDTDAKGNLRSVRPRPVDDLPRVPIQRPALWNKEDVYSKFRDYRI